MPLAFLYPDALTLPYFLASKTKSSQKPTFALQVGVWVLQPLSLFITATHLL